MRSIFFLVAFVATVGIGGAKLAADAIHEIRLQTETAIDAVLSEAGLDHQE